jgi:hypothetical protein
MQRIRIPVLLTKITNHLDLGPERQIATERGQKGQQVIQLPDFYVIVIIITIIIIIIIIITFMQGIYNYIPETNHVLGYVMLQLFCIYNLCYM